MSAPEGGRAAPAHPGEHSRCPPEPGYRAGLPTSGPGLTPAQEKANPPLSETELGTVLGKHVRDTLARTWNKQVAGQPRVRINAVGFYFESVEVGAFLWALARDNDGSFVGMSRP